MYMEAAFSLSPPPLPAMYRYEVVKEEDEEDEEKEGKEESSQESEVRTV